MRTYTVTTPSGVSWQVGESAHKTVAVKAGGHVWQLMAAPAHRPGCWLYAHRHESALWNYRDRCPFGDDCYLILTEAGKIVGQSPDLGRALEGL